MIDRADSDDAAQRSGKATSADDAAAGAGEADGAEARLQAWFALGAETLAVVEQLSTLLRLELGLALADAKRLVIVLLAMIPLVLFAWLGLGVLLAWLAYAASTSVALGLAAFLSLQVTTLLGLLWAARRFQRSLGLPATRRQWRALMQTLPAARDGQGRGP